jgi:dUTP pyrophosphatase
MLQIKLFEDVDVLEKTGVIRFLDEKRTQVSLPYKTKQAAAFDLFVLSEQLLYPNEITTVHTGIGFQKDPDSEFPLDVGLRLYIRSGISSTLKLMNAVGLIDPDYQGELLLKIKNISDTPYKLVKGDRIAQAEFFPVFRIPTAVVVENFKPTERSDGGFGHTGR